MNRIITTLPITPSSSSPLLRFYTPFIADVISRVSHTPFFMFCNTVGMKTTFDSKKQQLLFELYKKQLNTLYINFNTADHDGSLKFKYYFKECLQLLNSNNFIESKELDMAWCKCGKVEIPISFLEKYFFINNSNKNLVVGTSSDPKCKFCMQRLDFKKQSVKILNFDANTDLNIILPSKYKLQAEKDYYSLCEFPYIISRSQRKISYDTEFIWSTYINFIAPQSVDEIVMVLSPNNLNKAIRVVLITQMLKKNLRFRFIIHPLLRCNKTDALHKNLQLESVFDIFSNVNEIRGLLALSSKWNSNESAIMLKDLHYVKLCIKYLQKNISNDHKVEIDEVATILNRDYLNRMFKIIRSYKVPGDFDLWFLNHIFGLEF